MTKILLVSHSEKLAEGLKELLQQMQPDVDIEAAAGDSGGIGTDPDTISTKLQAWKEEEIVVLFDLGSAWMNTDLAAEMSGMEEQVTIADAAFVEGALAAVMEAGFGSSAARVKAAAEAAGSQKKRPEA
ncbi:dihydroxyacetone kinase phosphoryl donor subunit DhaM [Alkalicoccus chagannorensis]|uniref:dihydroxyacetone kinase phosphoryl donor subunit DhaM n=1 Tax=Alkalicoccus chagannorensis TaxID=427072 RepID=UPI00040C37E3|nr:dihydroxyacetone kinase phosphoryl donor subunit DhaM [Alkalicoccus chagannorensis]